MSHEKAVEFLRIASEADSFNRQEGLEDLKFRFGDQWPVQLQNSRKIEQRPMFTVNEIDSYCRQVVNSIRQQRPRGRCHPVGDASDVKIAQVITGIGRHIEVMSDADNAYDLAAEFAVTIGWGYFRLRNDYIREDSFDQDIFIDQIDNPFTVYFDPNSVLPDGSDNTRCLISEYIAKKEFEQLYPNEDLSPFIEGASGDSRSVDWIQREDIRIAEYFEIEKKKDTLLRLSDGMTLWKEELPPVGLLEKAQIRVVGERESWRKTVEWSKVYGGGTLEEKRLPGRYIPVIPVYGVNIVIDGKRRKMGMVRFGRDPQLMVNFWQTSITESIALAPKAKWLVAEGQIEGHETEWGQANNRAFPYLEYKTTDITGKEVPPPQRLQPEPPPSGMIEASIGASQAMQRVLGMFDPVNVKHSGPKSGEAIRAETGQSEQSNYHFYDNLTRSIKHAWRIILDYTPVVYDTQRVMRIIGDDGTPDLITINEKKDVEGAQKVLNDVTVGEYDVVMETGPGFNTKRQEGLANFIELLKSPIGQQIGQVGSDLIVRMMDAPGADVLADRLAAVNPLAQIDKKSDVPPEAQMKIKQLTQQLQQAQQLLQQAGLELKFKTNLALIKERGEDRREKMRIDESHQERVMATATKRHDVETRSETMLSVAEINAVKELLKEHVKNAHAVKEMKHEAEQKDKELASKENQKEPANG